jgi:hypothetical protein
VSLCQFDLLPDVFSKPLCHQRRAERIELHLLRVRQRGHQQQILTQCVVRAQRAKPLSPLPKDSRVRQPHTGNRPLGKRLNLCGI